MALTITKTKRNSVSGSKITAYMSVTFDVSYPAGGEAFDGDAVDVGGAIGAGGLTLLELANTSDKLDGYRIDVVISGSR